MLNIINKSVILNDEKLINVIDSKIKIEFEDKKPRFRLAIRYINLDIYNLNNYTDYILYNEGESAVYMLNSDRITVSLGYSDGLYKIETLEQLEKNIYKKKDAKLCDNIKGAIIEVIIFFAPVFSCLFKYREILDINVNPLNNIDSYDSIEKLFSILDVYFKKIKELQSFRKLNIQFNDIFDDLDNEAKKLI